MGNFIQVKNYKPKVGDVALPDGIRQHCTVTIKEIEGLNIVVQYDFNGGTSYKMRFGFNEVQQHFSTYLIKRGNLWEVSYLKS